MAGGLLKESPCLLFGLLQAQRLPCGPLGTGPAKCLPCAVYWAPGQVAIPSYHPCCPFFPCTVPCQQLTLPPPTAPETGGSLAAGV